MPRPTGRMSSSARKRVVRPRVLERDNAKCGVHIDGCGLPVTDLDVTIDHILPLAWLARHAENPGNFEAEFNYQVMHSRCNEKRPPPSRLGTEDFKFKCECHKFINVERQLYFSAYGQISLVRDFSPAFTNVPQCPDCGSPMGFKYGADYCERCEG